MRVIQLSEVCRAAALREALSWVSACAVAATLLRSASLLSVKLEGVIEETDLLYSTTRFDSQWRGAKGVSSGASQSEKQAGEQKKSKGRQQVARQKKRQFKRKDK